MGGAFLALQGLLKGVGVVQAAALGREISVWVGRLKLVLGGRYCMGIRDRESDVDTLHHPPTFIVGFVENPVALKPFRAFSTPDVSGAGGCRLPASHSLGPGAGLNWAARQPGREGG